MCPNARLVESFFQLLKRERIRRRTYPTRDAARYAVFGYIDMFNNSERKRRHIDMLSSVDVELRQRKLDEAGV